jgi:hypothetical protein
MVRIRREGVLRQPVESDVGVGALRQSGNDAVAAKGINDGAGCGQNHKGFCFAHAFGSNPNYFNTQ